MTVRKKHRKQEGILIDRINNTSDLENSSTYFNVDEFNGHFDTNTFNGSNTLHFNISSLSYNIDQLINGEDIINENNKIAEKFNNHFCKFAKIIENEISKTKNQFSDYLKNQMEQSCFINPTTSDKIESQITYLQNHKASSPSSIPTTIF